MSELLIDNSGAVRILTLNRPEKRNALNDGLVTELKAALNAANEDESLRALVVRGEGRDFCSGADLSSLQKIAGASYEANLEDAKSLAELFAMPRKMRVPVIAAVHGRALAGGCGELPRRPARPEGVGVLRPHRRRGPHLGAVHAGGP